jgi:uncharacterized coiled-coil protein SlyX
MATEAQAELERRVVDLEIRAAFQARTIEELDEVVRRFADRVERLERALAEVQARTAPAEGGSGDLPQFAPER